MVKIIVDKQTLSKRIADLQNGAFIELAIIPPQNDDGHYAPAFLHLTAIHTQGVYEDLDTIDESTISFD